MLFRARKGNWNQKNIFSGTLHRDLQLHTCQLPNIWDVFTHFWPEKFVCHSLTHCHTFCRFATLFLENSNCHSFYFNFNQYNIYLIRFATHFLSVILEGCEFWDSQNIWDSDHTFWKILKHPSWPMWGVTQVQYRTPTPKLQGIAWWWIRGLSFTGEHNPLMLQTGPYYLQLNIGRLALWGWCTQGVLLLLGACIGLLHYHWCLI